MRTLRFAHTQFCNLPRMIQFALTGGGVFGVGLLTLYLFVEVFGWQETTANAYQLVLTFSLNYLLNRHLTWCERIVSRLAVIKFLLSRTATTVANYYLFAWLVVSWQLHYSLANIVCVGLMTVINYVSSEHWVFADAAKPAVVKPVESVLQESSLQHS